MPREIRPAEAERELRQSYEEKRRELTSKLEELTKKFAAADAGGNVDERRWIAKEIDGIAHQIEDLDRENRQAA